MVAVSQDSPNRRRFAARLAAVQAVYQALRTGCAPSLIAREFLEHRQFIEVDGAASLTYDGVLFETILNGFETRKADIDELIKVNYKKENKEIEPLLAAVLSCAVCELLMNASTDAPVIINDYLDVTHAFYNPSEAGLVNGILDALAKVLRG